MSVMKADEVREALEILLIKNFRDAWQEFKENNLVNREIITNRAASLQEKAAYKIYLQSIQQDFLKDYFGTLEEVLVEGKVME